MNMYSIVEMNSFFVFFVPCSGIITLAVKGLFSLAFVSAGFFDIIVGVAWKRKAVIPR